MDVVKASINLNEGIIQLEGPQEFVEKYLDQYRQLIVSPATTTKAAKNSESTEKEKGKTTTKRKPRTRTGPTCAIKVQELLNEGYFKEPRTREDIQNQLLNKGVRYDSSIISATLNNFFRGQKLEKTGVRKNAKYYSNV